MSSTVFLKSSDNERFEVDKAVAEKSTMLKNMFEDGCFEGVIPVTNVTGKTLAKVVEYCKRHAACSGEEEEKEAESLKSWEAEFLAMERSELFDLIMAANFLDVKGLLDITCQAVADMIKDLTPEEIRKTFNIVNDFTPEEEEEIRRENQWAFE